LSKLILISDICSKIDNTHFRFKAFSKSFSKNNRVSSAYCRLMIPPALNLVSNPEIRPQLAALISIFEKTSAIMLKRMGVKGSPYLKPLPVSKKLLF
jgi:hypothetical protein